MSASMRAAGGAVWRRRPGGEVEVVLVHRPGHDDWILPKGKAEPGESDRDAALREVGEETAVTARLGPELVVTQYLDRDGRRKTVRWWAMEVLEVGVHEADHEIDELRWLALGDARRQLTYPVDQAILDALEELLGFSPGPG